MEKLGALLGLEIGLNSCDCGLKIYHAGFVVVNYEARIGKNVAFHGCNCVGNSSSGVPVIGDNVEFGVGSSVIGDVTIANNIKIGAGDVVTKSFDEENATIIGIPARILNSRYTI
jgi:serine O-acetyltransferase